MTAPTQFAQATVSSLPGSPVDGQECFYVADATAGAVWHLKYRAASGSSYKWEFVGGSPLFAEVTTDESTTSATYAALTTAGPSITLPLAGDYRVAIGAAFETINAAGTTGLMSYDIGGTGAVDANAAWGSWQASGATGNIDTGSRERVKTALTAVALVSKYKSTTANAMHFFNRWMRVTPVRVG
jgi:hypothetical protein